MRLSVNSIIAITEITDNLKKSIEWPFRNQNGTQ